jgi:hypothetical protein
MQEAVEEELRIVQQGLEELEGMVEEVRVDLLLQDLLRQMV